MAEFSTTMATDPAKARQIVYPELWISDENGDGLLLSDIGTNYEDEGRVVNWSPIRYAIDPLSSDIGRTETSVDVADTDGAIRAWLTAYNRRGADARIFWQDVVDANNYATIFVGILDSWAYQAGRVTLKLKSDDRWMRTYVPRVKLLKSEWPDLTGTAIEYYDTYIPLAYGEHDSTSLGPNGMVPLFPAKTTAGTVAAAGNYYIAQLGPTASYRTGGVTTGTLRVFKNGAQVTLGASDTFGTVTVGGKDFTVLALGTTTALDSDVFTLDYEASCDTNTIRELITNPVNQLRNFLIDNVFNEYKGGTLPHEDGDQYRIDGDSWGFCAVVADRLGLEGTIYVGGSQGQREAREVVTEWLESWPMFRLYHAPNGDLKMIYIDLKHPGYKPEADTIYTSDANPDIALPQRLSSEVLDAGDYSVELDAYNIVDRISCDHTFSELDGSLRSFEVQDMNANENTRESVSLVDSPRKV